MHSSRSNHASGRKRRNIRRSSREINLGRILILLSLLISVNTFVLYTWLRSLHLEWFDNDNNNGSGGVDQYMQNFISKVHVHANLDGSSDNSEKGYTYVDQDAISNNVLIEMPQTEESIADFQEAEKMDVDRNSNKMWEQDIAHEHETQNDRNAYASGRQINGNVISTPASARARMKQNIPQPKPKLFLHVGPRKTGTTTIQASFFLHKSFVRDEMAKDGIQTAVFPWNDGVNLVQDCLNKLPAACDPTEWHRFRKLIHDASIGTEQHKRGEGQGQEQQQGQGQQQQNPRRHVAISNEALSLVKPNEDTKIFLQALTDEWDVQVVVAHRPIEDWYLSMYQEDRSQTMYRKTTKMFRGWYTNDDADADANGEDVGNISYPAWFKSKWKHEYMGDPLDTIETYEYIFGSDKVTTLMMTRPDKVDITQQFLCEGLQAEHSCAKAKGRRVPIRHNVKSKFLFDEDLLVVAARDKGFIRNPSMTKIKNKACRNKLLLQRHFYTVMVKEYIEEEMDANDNNSATMDLLLPKLCIPSTQLHELIERAWSAEQRSPYPRSQKEFAAAIARFQSTSRHCSVNTDVALSQPIWVDFFAMISNDRLCSVE